MKNIYNLLTFPLLVTLCICISSPAQGADTSPEAEKARQEFEARCPKPGWWGRIADPDVRIDTYEDLISYWQNKERTKNAFFKAAYQAILDYPLDTDIVVTAINLMNYTSSYRHRIALQKYAVDNYFAFNSVHGKRGDTIAGIVENLARLYNDATDYDKTVSLIERLLNERGGEVNDHLLELITLEYAEALHRQHNTDKAVFVLEDALTRYNGSWKETLRKELARYQSMLTPPLLSGAAHPGTVMEPAEERTGRPDVAVKEPSLVHKTEQRDASGDDRIPDNAAEVKTTPLIDRPGTFQPWWNKNSQVVYTALIVFFLLLIIKNIVKSRTEQKPSRRY